MKSQRVSSAQVSAGDRSPIHRRSCFLDISSCRCSNRRPSPPTPLGPLVYENGDFYGRTVNVAARVAAYAEQGQVLVSEDVVSQAAGDDVCFRRVGPVSFKGVSRDVVVYEAERA